MNGWNGGGRPGLGQGGIERFRYTGKPAHLLTDVEVEKEGIRLSFNFELSPEALRDVERYELLQWNYLWSEGYGSKHYSLEDEWEDGEDEMEIEEIVPGEGGRSVLLKVPDMKPVNQVEINLELLAADGTEFEEQAYLTINKVPEANLPNMKEMVVGRTFMWERLEAERKQLAAKRAQEKARKKKEQAEKRARESSERKKAKAGEPAAE